MLEKKHKLRRLNQKGFTLIELLVVVAIIGILAAVGTVAYTGYTGSAKVTVTKQILNNTKKYITIELTNCLFSETIYDGNLDCSDIRSSSNKGITLGMATFTHVPNILGFKNAHDTKQLALKSGIKFVEGQISISGSGKHIKLNTCFKKPCSGDNVSTDLIEVVVD